MVKDMTKYTIHQGVGLELVVYADYIRVNEIGGSVLYEKSHGGDVIVAVISASALAVIAERPEPPNADSTR
jgi:hypothetical protein